MKSLILFLIPLAVGIIIFCICYRFIIMPIAKKVRQKDLEREAKDLYYEMQVIEELKKENEN